MKERPAESIIRWWRQPAGQHKLTEIHYDQRWSRGNKARGQGQGHKKNSRPRPRTAFPRTDPLEAKDRNARGQGQRTQPQLFSKKKVSKKVFQAISNL